MTKSAINSSFGALERQRQRLAKHRRRQTRARRIILTHLLNQEIPPPECKTGDEELDEILYNTALSKALRSRLGHSSSFSSLRFDEKASKNAVIMPVIRSVEEPRFSNAVLKLLSHHANGMPPCQAYSVHDDGRVTRNRRCGNHKVDADGRRDSTASVPNDASTGFLKGTQSANPHNDYCQHFVDTGERPQNFIRDTGLRNRFEEYPKLRELIRLKDEVIVARQTPPMYLRVDLRSFNLAELNSFFDVILVEPPSDHSWSWDEIEALEIEKIAAPRSFVWIWCGSGEGLDGARKCLKKWGFRRCEDICWIKTNKTRPGHDQLEPGSVLQRTKEHCLMGIHGTVRRSVDGDFIHANLDIDLIISEEPTGYGAREKPTEIFHIIEHFCLGRRRLHLFGRDETLRPGWLTVGNELTSSNFDAAIYNNYFTREPNGHLVGSTDEIERLRPKSPPPNSQQNQHAGPSNQNQANSSGGAAGLLLPQQTRSLGTASNTPSLLGKPTNSSGRMRPVDQNSALMNLISSLSAQNCLGQQNPMMIGSNAVTDNLASLQAALLLQQTSQGLNLPMLSGNGLADALQLFAAAASSNLRNLPPSSSNNR